MSMHAGSKQAPLLVFLLHLVDKVRRILHEKGSLILRHQVFPNVRAYRNTCIRYMALALALNGLVRN